MRRIPPDASAHRHLRSLVGHVGAGLVLASLIVGSAQGETAPRAPWRDDRAGLMQALRSPSLRPDERRALRMVLQEAIDRDPGGVPERAGTTTLPSIDGAWTRIPSPEPRAFHTAIHDPVRGRMIVFGGYDWWRHGRYDDVWALSLDPTPTWTPLPTAPFGTRWEHAAIYDPVRDRMIVFGGSGPGGFQNDVWSLSLGSAPAWTAISAGGPGPTPRSGATAIYDPVRDRMVLFGGWSPAGYSNEVWALSLDGTPTWSQITPAGTAPSARRWHSAIYDPVADRMVVFGGYGTEDETGDVWVLSFAGTPTWTELSPSGAPGTRSRHTAIYDPVRHRMVVFGSDNADLLALSLGSTPAWTTLTSTSESMDWGAAIYDPGRDAMVGFGGETCLWSIPSDAVWVFPMVAPGPWTTLQPVGRPPDGLWDAPVVYDPVRDRLLVGGLRAGTPDAGWWTLSMGETPVWRELAAQGVPPGGNDQVGAYDAVRDRVVVLGEAGSSLAAWSLSLGPTPTWAPIPATGTPPTIRDGHTVIRDARRDRLVIFGGAVSPDGPTNEVWTLTLGNPPTWSQMAPLGIPPAPRAYHTAIYDPFRDRMVVFAGDVGSYSPADVWALSLDDAPTWTPIVPQGGPMSPRLAHSAIFDPMRDRMVIFGGQDDPLSEVWALSLENGPEWSQLAPAGPEPQPRCYQAATYDPRRDRMMIVGGNSACATPDALRDVWTLTWGAPRLPSVSFPVAGAQVTAGTEAQIAWTLPAGLAVDSVAVLVTVDNQRSWEVVGHGPATWSSCAWAAPAMEAESCYVAVEGCVAGDVVGVGFGGPFGVGSTVGVVPVPDRFELRGARPNPFHAGGRIAFGVPVASPVTLQVFDLRGRLVETLVNGPMPAGRHEVAWSARGVAAGVFFVQLRSGALRESRSLVLVR